MITTIQNKPAIILEIYYVDGHRLYGDQIEFGACYKIIIENKMIHWYCELDTSIGEEIEEEEYVEWIEDKNVKRINENMFSYFIDILNLPKQIGLGH